ncbi:WEB family protein At5g55860 [Elaeis guineensis]|uniref:WEB family protein At5g55860 n=1 Tax=Elaeis guineensis var. tenera TaxID=51953 RepID=A0A6I9RUM4_ELAGV|nr:WEB family protein At5g55860 [Elaeis guineensis]
MGVKAHQNVTDSPKAEVGEIDTRAPFESVRAAVSLFGEVAFSADRPTARKPKPSSAERALAKETQLHLAQKELNKYKEQIKNAETTRVQALAELEGAKKSVEELTHKLNTINESKDLALKATEAAKNQTKELEDENSSDGTGKDSAWKQELDSAREQYAVAITELDAAKQELRRIKKDFESSMEAKLRAFHQEAEAKRLSDVNTEKAAQLSKEIAATQESLMHVKLATEQAQQEELKIHSEKDAARQSYKQALEDTEKKLASLHKEFDPELHKNLEVKLAETTAEIGAIQKEMEDARASDLESLMTVRTELDGAKDVLQKIAEEESSLKTLVESLKLELEAVKKEHDELKEKDAETESVVGNLHIKLQKCKNELEAAVAAEFKATSASDDLMSALQQLSSESESAIQEAEAMKKTAEELRNEAEASQIALAEAEKKLQVALKDAEEAKASEARALDQIKELSEKANAARASTSESGAKITISKEEFESLSRKVDESGKLTEMKVAAAMAQVEAVRASENESIKRLEVTRKEMEDIELATEEALKRAEMAEAAKKAVEGELRRWREREQKRAAEAASRILVETQMSVEASQTKPKPPNANIVETAEGNQKVNRAAVSRKTVLPNFSGIFHRKRNQVDGGSPSYLPGEKPV